MLTAHALHTAQVHFVTHVPGYGATQTFASYQILQPGRSAWLCFHEEVAYSMAHGASLMGQRSACLIKAHGVAKAANAIVTSLTAGCTAGLVLLVFDDPAGKHSDNILDTPRLLDGLRLPFHRPEREQIGATIHHAFYQSELLQLPVAVLLEADGLPEGEAADLPPLPAPEGSWQRHIHQQLLCPLLTQHQEQILQAKLSGRAWVGLPAPQLPPVPDGLPAGWQTAVQPYLPFFEQFRHLRGPVVMGDTSLSTLFALPPYHCVDICTYFGGSIPLAAGAYAAGQKEVWALTGDFSFIAAGHLGLLEAWQRQLPLKVVIFANGRAQATGGQPVPEGVLAQVLAGYAPAVQWVERPEEIRPVLERVKWSQKLEIVVVKID